MVIKHFVIKITDRFPRLHIQYKRNSINWIEIDIGHNKSNNNYWFDIVILGLGFNYDSVKLYNRDDSFILINDWKRG
jgi:hypothetical protein